MNIQNYLKKLNSESQRIFEETIKDIPSFGKVHHVSSSIFEFSDQIVDTDEQKLFRVVSAQLESSALSLSLGLYRQAFSTLRLAFEMGLGSIHFSAHKLEHKEWLNGKADNKWSKLIDVDNGVLSIRFANAFFPELITEIPDYNTKAREVYRKLSEFVHGNHETWEKSGMVLKKNDALVIQYFQWFNEVAEIMLVILCCRYLKSFSATQLELINSTKDELSHISPIQSIFNSKG